MIDGSRWIVFSITQSYLYDYFIRISDILLIAIFKVNLFNLHYEVTESAFRDLKYSESRIHTGLSGLRNQDQDLMITVVI
jgi:hypothetical protein